MSWPATVALIAFLVCFVECRVNETLHSRTKIPELSGYYEEWPPVGLEINCTEEEKECYKLNRVLHSDGRCYMLQHNGPCETEFSLYFNKTKAEEGEYKAVCLPNYKCKDIDWIYMAHDQTCYSHDLNLDFCKNKVHFLTDDYFGEGRCQCLLKEDCPPRSVIEQPEEVGRCRLPDVLHLDYPYVSNPLMDRPFPCTPEQHACFKEKTVLHQPSGKCFPLLQRGPCEDGEIFVMNKTVFDRVGQLEGVCSKPACPEGQLLMQFDGRCYTRDDVVEKLCPPRTFEFDVFGHVGCAVSHIGYMNVGLNIPRYLTKNNQCSDWFYWHDQ